MSCSEGKCELSKKQRNMWVVEALGHVNPWVYREHNKIMLRKTNLRRSNPSGHLQVERYGLLCMLRSILCGSPTKKCLISS